jgi:hypothetical protein
LAPIQGTPPSGSPGHPSSDLGNGPMRVCEVHHLSG